MGKIFVNVKLEKIHSYMAPGYGYKSGYETHYIYVMKGDDGKTYVWKTSQIMKVANPNFDCIHRHNDNNCYEGDVLYISGNFKCESEFRGQIQTLINRVEVLERSVAGNTPEEKLQIQLNSVKDNDKIVEMSYREYKTKYDGCETVLFSYNSFNKTIKVIIRNVNSN